MLIKTENTDLGYLLVDHRNSPDLPPGVQNQVVEMSTYTCSHCNGVVIMNPERHRPREFCKGCNHMVCDNCAAIKVKTGICKTFSQVVDEILSKQGGS